MLAEAEEDNSDLGMVMDGLSFDQYEPMPDGLRSPSVMCGPVGSSEMFHSGACSSVTNLGCVEGQYHTNNEQTQSDECII